MLSTDNIDVSYTTLADVGMDAESIEISDRALKEFRQNNRAPTKTEVEQMGFQNRFNESLAKVLFNKTGDMNLVQQRFSHGRPIMSEQEQAVVCKQLASKVTVQYPEVTADDPIVSSTAHIEQQAMLAIETSARLAQKHQLAPEDPQQAFTARAVTESAIRDAENVSNDHRRQFWQFQNSVNASSATPPSYVDAYKTLKLDVNRPTIPTDEAATTTTALILLPHQVQAITWLVEVSQSSLSGGICADKMGLGKTIFALASLIIFQRQAAVTSLVPPPPTNVPISSIDDIDPSTPPANNQTLKKVDEPKEADEPSFSSIKGSANEASGPSSPTESRSTRLELRRLDHHLKTTELRGRIAKAAEMSTAIRQRRYRATLILAPSQALRV